MPLFTVVESSDVAEGVGYSQYRVSSPRLAMAEWIRHKSEPEAKGMGFPSVAHMIRALERDPPRSAAPLYPGVRVASLGYRGRYFYLIATRTQRSDRAKR
jgi:hypothetical protein